MPDEGNRAVVERYIAGIYSDVRNVDVAQYMHPNFIEDWPQSGERIRGVQNHAAVRANYPDPGRLEGQLHQIAGSEDRWVTTPSWTILKIEGTGDVYTATGTADYPNGDHYHIVNILRLRDEKIVQVTTFFAAPFEAAAWRHEWVEPIPKG